jgi:hypothetical protein
VVFGGVLVIGLALAMPAITLAHGRTMGCSGKFCFVTAAASPARGRAGRRAAMHEAGAAFGLRVFVGIDLIWI